MKGMGSFHKPLLGQRDEPFRRALTTRRAVSVSYSDAERAARICLNDLVADAFPLAHRPVEGFAAALAMRRGPRWLRVPVAFEVGTARSRPGQVAHLRWRALRCPRLFPTMEADVSIRMSRRSRTELRIEGVYEPPFGLLGAIGDALLGRRVARSTLEAFIDGLGDALEAALTDGRCGHRVTMPATSTEATPSATAIATSPSTGSDHRELLHAARELYLAAGIGETEALAQSTSEFRVVLDRHLATEAASLQSLPPLKARSLERGQRQLVDLARRIEHDAARACGQSDLGCREGTKELLARCFLQARDERVALRVSREPGLPPRPR